MNISAKFQLHPLITSEEMNFGEANRNFSLSVAIKFSGLDKIHIFSRGLLKEYFCKTFVKLSAMRQK